MMISRISYLRPNSALPEPTQKSSLTVMRVYINVQKETQPSVKNGKGSWRTCVSLENAGKAPHFIPEDPEGGTSESLVYLRP